MQSDVTLTVLSNVVHQHWPRTRQDCPDSLLEYWNHREEISHEDGLLLKSHRQIIPQSERAESLKVLHLGHYAISKMQLTARETVCWPGINKDIETAYKNCKTCGVYSNSQQKETLLPHKVLDAAWESLGTDIFHLNKNQYLLVVDYYSWFPVIRKITNLTSKTNHTAQVYLCRV